MTRYADDVLPCECGLLIAGNLRSGRSTSGRDRDWLQSQRPTGRSYERSPRVTDSALIPRVTLGQFDEASAGLSELPLDLPTLGSLRTHRLIQFDLHLGVA